MRGRVMTRLACTFSKGKKYRERHPVDFSKNIDQSARRQFLSSVAFSGSEKWENRLQKKRQVARNRYF